MAFVHTPAVPTESRHTPHVFLACAVVIGTAVGLAAAGLTASFLVGPAIAIPAAAIGWHDLQERRIPNVVVLAAATAAVLIAVAVELLEHRQAGLGLAAGAGVAAGPLLVAHLLTPSGIGWGDVKYAVTVGAALGVLDWRLALPAAATAAIAGPALAVAIPSWRRSIPLGSLLGVSAIVVLLVAGIVR